VGQPLLKVEVVPSVTIFVGPNNSGKSQALREIFSFCQNGTVNVASRIVEKLMFSDRNRQDVLREFETLIQKPNVNETVGEAYTIVKVGSERFHIQKNEFIEACTTPNTRSNQFAAWYLRHQTLNLDGPGRIGLLNGQGRGDLKFPAAPLARLLTNDEKRASLRKVVFDAVGLYFAIDASQGDQLNVRFGRTPPPDERRFHDETLAYMREALDIGAVSDGVKAFTGILLQLHAGDPKVIIVDEPEAFLHPSLALKLGKELAKGAAIEGKHIFASTHSSQFVMGAILSGAKVNIIRLTYSPNSGGTARLLSNAELNTLMKDPLLRSVGVLGALFYDYVIVAEADADRAFYQEINERLLAADDPRGIPNALFLNAENKQAIPKIVAPLRKLGIPTAAIADIDVLKDGGDEWTRHLKACGIPIGEHQPYGTRRVNVLDALRNKNSEFKIAGGIALLEGAERESAENLLGDLGRYGLFVVPRGEVEAWLSSLSVSRSKHGWLRSIFEVMGSDINAEGYVKPGPNDVWDFLARVRNWLVDPNRRGIPA
jgi:ABC-type cobalamin/Fe3+-siderophores transport system ATPase subunit